jgi:hypothetical protein
VLAFDPGKEAVDGGQLHYIAKRLPKSSREAIKNATESLAQRPILAGKSRHSAAPLTRAFACSCSL